ncbi:MAG: hypothetical protein LBG48_03930 [Rickettsiales bacterium]|jgi:hypothetical protein|nr:hypothetical protein [Rickettsiales bacterium]
MTDKKINDFIKNQEKINKLFEMRIIDIENSYSTIFNKVFAIEHVFNLPRNYEKDEEDIIMEKERKKMESERRKKK